LTTSTRAGRVPRGIGFYLIMLIVLATVPLVVIAGVLVARQAALQRQAFEKSLVLSHELRNPLAPVRNAIPLLRMLAERPDPATLRTLVDMLDRQTAQLTRLVNDLLEVSRITSGRIELARARLDLRSVARQAREALAPSFEQRRQRVTSELPPDPVEVVGDHARLSQVVSNLLDNAAKFTPEGGRIGLALRTDGAQALLTVRDDGSGIDPAVLPHEAHSAGVGKGSEFVLRLALAASR
jgi:signal transduction histidine kinase